MSMATAAASEADNKPGKKSPWDFWNGGPKYWQAWEEETTTDQPGIYVAPQKRLQKETKKKSRPASNLNKDPQPECDLYDLVLDRNWHRVVRHCQQRPLDASYQDGDDLDTPLYLACQNKPPVRIVRALLQAWPEAALTKSRHGDLPLHLAARYNASLEVLKELVKDHPETAVATTKYDKTAILALWEGREATTATTTSGNKQQRDGENYQTVFWQKVDVLLQAVARHRQQEHPKAATAAPSKDPDTLYIVHAAVSLGALKCPNQVFEYAMHQYPHQASAPDHEGRLPLHVAVMGSHHNANNGRKYKPREQVVLERLLQAHPAASRTPDPTLAVGRMPLHTALQNRHSWHGGVRTLVQRAPEVILQPDPLTRLYPWQLAAVPIRPTVSVELDTIYRLLRMQPAVLEHGRQQQLRGDSALFLREPYFGKEKEDEEMSDEEETNMVITEEQKEAPAANATVLTLTNPSELMSDVKTESEETERSLDMEDMMDETIRVKNSVILPSQTVESSIPPSEQEETERSLEIQDMERTALDSSVPPDSSILVMGAGEGIVGVVTNEKDESFQGHASAATVESRPAAPPRRQSWFEYMLSSVSSLSESFSKD